MPIYKQTTELTKCADWLTATDHDITEVYFGDKQVFTVWDTYDGTLPAQYSANGSTLADYRIYGAAGGVGDRTENIYTRDTNRSGYYNNNGGFSWNPYYITSTFLPIDINKNVYVGFFSTHSGGFIYQVGYFDASKAFISLDGHTGSGYGTFSIQSTPPNNAAYAVFCATRDSSSIIVTNSSAAPAAYVPYGYEVDMSVSDGTASTTTPIYIGGTALGEDEYVDYGEQKVYRRTENLVGIFESVEINGAKFKFDGARVYISGTASATIASNNANYKIFKITLLAGTYNIMEFRSQAQTGFGGWVMWAVSDNTRIAYSKTAFTLSEDTEVYIGFYIIAGSVLDFSIGFVILPESEGAITEYIPYYDPQDPPVPLPALPTVDGTNIVDYAGQSAPPSEFYAKYRKQNF